MLVHGRREVVESAQYGLWVDFFESPDEVTTVFPALLAQVPREHWGAILDPSGPVPWDLKRDAYALAREDPRLHGPLIKGLIGSFYDVYGQVDAVEAARLCEGLNLGPDPEVIHELVKLRTWRDNFWFKRSGIDVYRDMGGQHKIDINDTVAGWEDHTRYVERIRNFRAKPIEVEIRRPFGGHTFFISRLEPTRHDYQTPQIVATCPAREKTELAYHIRTLQGYLAKQQNVTLEEGE